jgi:hypothetical protein
MGWRSLHEKKLRDFKTHVILLYEASDFYGSEDVNCALLVVTSCRWLPALRMVLSLYACDSYQLFGWSCRCMPVTVKKMRLL